MGDIKILGGNTIFVGSFKKEAVAGVGTFPEMPLERRRWKATIPRTRKRGSGDIANVVIRYEPVIFYLSHLYSSLIPDLWQAIREAYDVYGRLKKPAVLEKFGRVCPGAGEIFPSWASVGHRGNPPKNYFYEKDGPLVFPEQLEPYWWRPVVFIYFADVPRYGMAEGYVSTTCARNAMHRGLGSSWAPVRKCKLQFESFPKVGEGPIELWKTEGAWRWEAWASTSAGRWADLYAIEVVSMPVEKPCEWEIQGATGLKGSNPRTWSRPL